MLEFVDFVKEDVPSLRNKDAGCTVVIEDAVVQRRVSAAEEVIDVSPICA